MPEKIARNRFFVGFLLDSAVWKSVLFLLVMSVLPQNGILLALFRQFHLAPFLPKEVKFLSVPHNLKFNHHGAEISVI